jgi:hypothetical protein
MVRAVTFVVAILSGMSPVVAVAQHRSWLINLAGGYSHGIGGDFGGSGSVSGTAGAFRPVGRIVDVGVELGYHGLGTTTTRIQDLYGPGSTYQEDFTRRAWQATAAVRLRPAGSASRLYVIAGAGAYLVGFRDMIEARDAAGQPLPQYQFRQSDSELHPGVHLGAGVDRLVSLGRLGIGVHARWHGVIAGGIGDFFSIGLGVALDAGGFRRPP